MFLSEMFDIAFQHWLVFYLGGYLTILSCAVVDGGKRELRILSNYIGLAFWPFFILFWPLAEEGYRLRLIGATLLCTSVGYISSYAYHEMNLSSEEQLVREKIKLAEEKRELE